MERKKNDKKEEKQKYKEELTENLPLKTITFYTGIEFKMGKSGYTSGTV